MKLSSAGLRVKAGFPPGRSLYRAKIYGCQHANKNQKSVGASQTRTIVQFRNRQPRMRNTWSLSSTLPRRNFHPTPAPHATKDPYTVLGVNKKASSAEIKKAYYGLAKKYHPDTNNDPGSKDMFAEAQSAYEILSDSQKKSAWDQFGAAAFDQGAGPGSGAGPGAGGSPFSGNPFGGGASGPFSGGFGGFGGQGFGSEFDINDLFESFSGKRSSRSKRGRNPFSEYTVVGENIEVQVDISFMDAAKGTSKTINIKPTTKCKTCSGKGLKPGTERSKCKACGGSGSQIYETSGFHVSSTCSVCQGEGTTVPRGAECRPCSGDGVVRERKTVRVDIPGGVEDSMRLVLKGEGDTPPTGKIPDENIRATPGDLYIRVRVAKDPQFGRNGSNILYTSSIPLTTAILGGEVTVPTLDGETRIKVATGTSTGDKITLTGMGMKRPGQKGSGDLKVEFKVAMPKYLSANQRTIVEMLAEEMGDKTAKRMMNFGKQPVSDSNSNSKSTSNRSESTPLQFDEKNEGFLKSVWHKWVDNPSGNANENETSPPTSSSTGDVEDQKKASSVN